MAVLFWFPTFRMTTPRSFHASLSACVFYPTSKRLPESTATSKSLGNVDSSLDKGEELLTKSPATVLFPNQLHFDSRFWQVFAHWFVCRIMNIHFLILLWLWASCYFIFISFTEISGNSTSACLPYGIQLLLSVDIKCYAGV